MPCARSSRRMAGAGGTWRMRRAKRRSSATWRACPCDCVATHRADELDLDQALDGADLVLVHEWNEPALIERLGRHRLAGGRYLLLFHDTHHRALTRPAEMARYRLEGYDGVLAFGATVREIYLRQGWARRAWIWHEAADLRSFRPLRDGAPELDLVWIGNWGDEERTARARGVSARADHRPWAARRRSTASAIRSAHCAGFAAGGSSSAAGCPTTSSRRPSPAPGSPCTCRDGPTRVPCRASPRSGSSRRWPAASRWSRRPGTIVEGLFTPGEDFLMASDPAGMRTALAFGAARPGARGRACRAWPPHDRAAPQLRASGRRAARDLRLARIRALRAQPAEESGRMRIAFFGSSLLSAYWNGAATYYRGILKALAMRGHEVVFLEPDAFDRQRHRDIEPPPWARVVVYVADTDGLREALAHARGADLVVKASGVGVLDAELEAGVLEAAPADALVAFWDVDAPATLARLEADPRDPLARAAARLRPGPHLRRRHAGLRRLSPARRTAVRADLQRARSRRPSSGAAGPPLRRRSRVPRQPPARSRGAGRGVLPQPRPRRHPSSASCSAAAAGTTSRCRRTCDGSGMSRRATTMRSTAPPAACSTSAARAWR